MRNLNYELKQLCYRNRDGSYATQADRWRMLDLIANQLHELGYKDMRATSLKPKHVEALAGRWQAESLSPGTMKNRMSVVRWWSEKIGKQNVVARDNDQYGIPERQHVTNVSTSEDFKHFVLLSLLTGARRSNVLSMQWQDINMKTGTWTIPDSKNDEPVNVPLVPEAVAILTTRKAKPTGFVFPAPSKTGHVTPPKKRWADLRKRANVADLRIHDLRRSLGSWQAISGASLAIIGKSLGHKSADATMIYARLHLDPVRASVNTATSAMLEAAGVKTPAAVVALASRKRAKAK